MPPVAITRSRRPAFTSRRQVCRRRERVQPSGFVGLKSGQTVVQGVDLSELQDETDLAAAFGCGATFAYIQLSSGTAATDHSYRLYWPNARAAGLIGVVVAQQLMNAETTAVRFQKLDPFVGNGVLCAVLVLLSNIFLGKRFGLLRGRRRISIAVVLVAMPWCHHAYNRTLARLKHDGHGTVVGG